MNIRAATKDDADAVLALWGRAGAAPSITDDAEAIKGLIEHDPDALIVATIDGEIVGSLVVGWDGWRGNMYRLAVDPDYRRGGIASALVAAGERRLREKGCVRITALVLRDEPDAIALWRQVGFSEQPEIARYTRNLD